jgi:predicted secreted protein
MGTPAYAGSQAQAGRGTIIAIGATPVPIGECSDLPLNRPEWDSVDVTNFDSGMDEEQLVTIRKAATITITGNRVASDAGQLAAEAAYQSGEKTPFTITLPKSGTETTSGTVFTFTAYVKGVTFKVTPTGKVEFTLNLQTTGGMPSTPGT